MVNNNNNEEERVQKALGTMPKHKVHVQFTFTNFEECTLDVSALTEKDAVQKVEEFVKDKDNLTKVLETSKALVYESEYKDLGEHYIEIVSKLKVDDIKVSKILYDQPFEDDDWESEILI